MVPKKSMKDYIPLSVPSFRGRERKYVAKAVRDEWVSTGGAFVTQFERNIAQYNNIKHAVACTNGTVALQIALLECRIGHDDEVIVPTVTFIAPINTIRYLGAEPVFMDCDEYLNIDVKKIEEFIEKECKFDGFRLTNRSSKRQVKAIIPVHIFGNPVDIECLMHLAERYKLKVIEDATESLGSYYIKGKYKNKKTGTIGNINCYSFNGNKIITTGGGGMIVTDDEISAKHMKYLTTQAKDNEIYYIHNEIGYNYRMTNLQAALGLAQLELLDQFVKTKRRNFKRYRDALENYKGLSFIKETAYSYSNYWFYSLVIDKDKFGLSRDELMEKLSEKNIQTRPLWYLNHLQKPYKDCQAFKIERSHWLYERVLNIPCSVSLKDEEIDQVVSAIKSIAE